MPRDGSIRGEPCRDLSFLDVLAGPDYPGLLRRAPTRHNEHLWKGLWPAEWQAGPYPMGLPRSATIRFAVFWGRCLSNLRGREMRKSPSTSDGRHERCARNRLPVRNWPDGLAAPPGSPVVLAAH